MHSKLIKFSELDRSSFIFEGKKFDLNDFGTNRGGIFEGYQLWSKIDIRTAIFIRIEKYGLKINTSSMRFY